MRRRRTDRPGTARPGTGDDGRRRGAGNRRRRDFRDATGEAGLAFLKIVLVIALVGTVAVDAARPLLTRLQLDNRAGRAVADLDTTLDAAGGNVQRAHDMLQLELDTSDPEVVVDTIGIDDDGPTTVATVTLSRRSGSLVLRDLFGLDSWYDVSVTRSGPVD